MRMSFATIVLAITMIQSPSLAQTSPAQPVVLAEETILRVSGEGSVEVPPEIMQVEIGVMTTGKTANDALDENSQRVGDLLSQIWALGIAPKDVETTRLNVEPEYSELKDPNEIVGWRAENGLTVRTRDLARAGEIVTALFEAGGNDITTPGFLLSEESSQAVSRRAEAKALREARDQADAAAKVLGMRVSRVLLVSDSKVRFSRYGNAIVVTGSRIRRPTVPVEPAQVKVNATYNMEFALVPN